MLSISKNLSIAVDASYVVTDQTEFYLYRMIYDNYRKTILEGLNE